jgi:basic membrane lipoprotein Med (substrate-binding protein (PBP1-ABC) superfamily)/DNA-binding SARP family transcriptional activator
LDFSILGPIEVTSKGRTADLGPRKQRALLAVLLLRVGEIVPIDHLIEMLWGDRPPRTAAHSIQIYVSDLRKALLSLGEANALITRPPGYVLSLDPTSIDARRFERLVGEGTRSLRDGLHAEGEAAIAEALGLWRGPPLSDFAYEEFAQPEIRRLNGLRLDALEMLAAAELDAGLAHEALPLVETVIRDDPLRERARELQMLALYRTGRHAEALRAYQQFHALLAEELGLDPSPPLRQLQERILLHDPSLGSEAHPKPKRGRSPARNPYKGLRAFGEEDWEDFFGRESLVDRLLDEFRGQARLLALVGPSGCGKSSVVGAGLIPALRQGALPGSDRWLIAQMTPGEHPFAELQHALARAAENRLDGPIETDGSVLGTASRLLPEERGRLILVVDQFEELFSVGDEDEGPRFLRELAKAVTDPSGRVVVLLTLRADFYDRPLLQPDFARVFTAGVVNVLPMTAGEIEAAVVTPARGVGVAVDPALLAEVVAATVDRPGTLPLLQYALTEVFDRRSGSELTLGEYRSLGGLLGALSRRAEELYGRFDSERRELAKQVFLRLVRVGEGTRDARRRVPIGELMALNLDPVALSDVLEEFGRHRLLSFDRDAVSGDATVEAAHEALLWEWNRLAEWIDRHRADLRRHRSMATAVEEWDSSERHADYLLTGARLTEFDQWARSTTLQLTERERQFLDAGLERRREEEAREAERLERQRRLERRARTRLLALAAALAVLTAGVVYGVMAWLGNRPPEVVLVFEGGGDAGFNDMIQSGFHRAIARFDIDAQTLTANELTLESTLRGLAEDGVRLIVVGFGPLGEGAVDAIARDFPDTRFVAIDYPGDLPNVSYLTSSEAQGSFLVGAAAALKSRTGIIGFIGGVDVDVIWRFQAGYEAGARTVDPDIEVRTTFLTQWPDVSGFGSPTLATRAANELYGEGADVVFHAAGYSGVGLFEAARARSEEEGRHLWAIGVDTDQYRSLLQLDFLSDAFDLEAWQQHVLTSMVKRLDRAIYAGLQDYARGRLTPGVRQFDLAAGGVEISYSGGFIDDIRPQIEALRERIVSGEIVVPVVPEGKPPTS